MEKTGRFDYGKVQGFWSAKHPFKKIKDICEYGLTQRSTFPKRKQQKQQLRGHWGKKSQSNRKMEKVNRWGDLPETTTGFCHPKKDTRSGPKSPWMEKKKCKWSQDYKTHVPIGGKRPWSAPCLKRGDSGGLETQRLSWELWDGSYGHATFKAFSLQFCV